jgi:hypothetical protein
LSAYDKPIGIDWNRDAGGFRVAYAAGTSRSTDAAALTAQHLPARGCGATPSAAAACPSQYIIGFELKIGGPVVGLLLDER